MTDEVAMIAAGLTKAQRAAILNRRTWEFGLGMWPLRNALRRKELIVGNGSAFTPLGLAVRAYLQAEAK